MQRMHREYTLPTPVFQNDFHAAAKTQRKRDMRRMAVMQPGKKPHLGNGTFKSPVGQPWMHTLKGADPESRHSQSGCQRTGTGTKTPIAGLAILFWVITIDLCRNANYFLPTAGYLNACCRQCCLVTMTGLFISVDVHFFLILLL